LIQEEIMAVRTVVQIDEDKCDGCGLCVPGCAEGALQIVDGKAKLVSDIYCDGLGACLGECPQGAITLVEREAEEFDEKAVKQRLKEMDRKPIAHDHEYDHGHGHSAEAAKAGKEKVEDLACGCPGTLSQKFDRPQATAPSHGGGPAAASMLGNWPVQIMLVPPKAPYLDGADLLIAADCAPFAYGDFHRRFLEGKTLLVGCPKLDSVDVYLEKLTAIFRDNDIRSIGVVYMEVPCCGGLVQLVKSALDKSGRRISTTLYKIGIKGDFVEERALPEAAA
jgi:Pyruvate/2-oxoacid:ferredoxin oxidoreductase delta subunit